MNRIIEYFLEDQNKNMIEQIYHISFILDTENVALTIDAKHFCVKSRGVEDLNVQQLQVDWEGASAYKVRAEF